MNPHCVRLPNDAVKLLRWADCNADRTSGADILTFDLMFTVLKSLKLLFCKKCVGGCCAK
jgi:hypothetical protein